MNITPLKQTRDFNCGQTCVAMLTGKTIAEVEQVYGHGHETYPSEHIKAVTALGCYADERGFVDYEDGMALPEVALVRIGYRKRNPKTGGYSKSKTKRLGHLVVWANGQFYNPSNAQTIPFDGLSAGVKIDRFLAVLVP